MSIAVRQVTKRFDNGFVAVDNVSLAIAGGSLTALLGPSGAHPPFIIAGLETPDEGDVSILGRDVTGVPPQKREVGFVFQHYAAFKHMTVRTTWASARRSASGRSRRSGTGRRACSAACSSTASPTATRVASAAGRQRMALARALRPRSPRSSYWTIARRPRRPRARSRRTIPLLIHDEGAHATVLVTHDQEEATDTADRVTAMNDGRIEQSGEAARPLRAPGQRVRHELRRAGQPPRGGMDPGRTTSSSASSQRGTTSAGDDPADRPPRLRGARRARVRRRQALSRRR